MSKTRKGTLYLLLAAAIVFGMLFVGRMQVSAATKPTNLRQTTSSSSSFTVEWDSALGNQYHFYRLSESENFSNPTAAKQIYGSNNSQHISGNLSAGKTYYVQIGAADSNSSASAVWSDPLEVVTKPSDVVSKSVVQTGATTTSISLKWDAVPGANYYEIGYYPTDGKQENAQKTTASTNSITISGLKKNTKYYIDLYAGRKSSAGYKAQQSYATTKSGVPVLPSKVTGVENTVFYAYTNSASFEWDKSNVTDQYQYQIYDNSGKKQLTKTCSYHSVSVSSSKLKKLQFYKIRVRGYISVNGNQSKYGEWSDWLYFARSPYQTVKLKNSGNNIKVSWGKITGATGYTVYVSTKSSSGYKKVTTVSSKKTSVNISKYGKSKLKKGKTYYVQIVANKKAKYNGKKSKTFKSYTYFVKGIRKT